MEIRIAVGKVSPCDAKRDNLVPSSQLRNLNELKGGGDMYLVAHCN